LYEVGPSNSKVSCEGESEYSEHDIRIQKYVCNIVGGYSPFFNDVLNIIFPFFIYFLLLFLNTKVTSDFKNFNNSLQSILKIFPILLTIFSTLSGPIFKPGIIKLIITYATGIFLYSSPNISFNSPVQNLLILFNKLLICLNEKFCWAIFFIKSTISHILSGFMYSLHS